MAAKEDPIEDITRPWDSQRKKLGEITFNQGANKAEIVHVQATLRRAGLLGQGYLLCKKKYRGGM